MIAFVFPGQGSQSLGMLSALAAQEPLIEQAFAEASQVLGYDLWALCQNGPAERLGATEFTQPAMLAAGVATFRAWRARGGPMPAMMAGHSLGEYTALVCSGSLDYRTAVALVQFRGAAMQGAVPAGEGAMAALLGLDDTVAEEICAQASGAEVVVAANYNSPGQIVIAGHTTAVNRAIELASARGAKRAIRLPVSVPSHSPLMQPAALQLSQRLQAVAFDVPQDVVVYSVNVARHQSADGIRRALAEQLVQPVRWSATVRTMIDEGARALIECGPGNVLTGLNRRIDRNKDIAMLAIDDEASLNDALARCRTIESRADR